MKAVMTSKNAINSEHRQVLEQMTHLCKAWIIESARHVVDAALDRFPGNTAFASGLTSTPTACDKSSSAA